MFMPSLYSSQLKILGTLARQRLREGLLALADFRAAHKRFPTLEEASGLIPLDPFTNRPLIYRLTNEGFVLYSVSDNFKDDGGTTEPARKGDPAPDLVLKYPIRLALAN
jgi:hypothetical protein